jgi:cell division septation protein DedD/uncharacterized protein YdeI (BOF family)
VQALLLATLVALPAVGPAAAKLEPGADGGATATPSEAGLLSVDEEAHLLVSELVTGGASASDEMIELYNPGTTPLPLEGLELIYVSSTGTTVSRRATWSAGAPSVAPGGHVLVANSAGAFAAIADATYATGMSATGGSVALRILGAATALDAVGWGTATGSWLEGTAAPAPPPGSSLERLPGGSAGSSQDGDDNLTDFAIRAIPDPQNSGSSPVPPDATASPAGSPSPSPVATPSEVPEPTTTPSATATPQPTATPDPTVEPTTAPSPTPAATPTPSVVPTPTVLPSPTVPPTPGPTQAPAAISISAARSLPDDSTATVEAVALTGSDFADGGGFVADASGGIAVLVTDGAFSRGQLLRLAGKVDNRYQQRTLRVAGSDIVVLGGAAEPDPVVRATGAINESVEGQLVHVEAPIVSGPDLLSGGVAFGIDDGSGEARVVINAATGIGIDAWEPGVTLELIAVVGQRDSSGTGTAGYRVQPRDGGDVLAVVARPDPTTTPTPLPSVSPSASPTPSATLSAAPSASASPDSSAITIAAARTAASGASVRIRGVITSPTGRIEAGSAVIQDGTGAILLRMSGGAPALERGALVELDGTRSTKSGMLTLRVGDTPTLLGRQAEPVALRLATGSAGEPHEARLVTVRGALTGSPRKSSAGSTSFAIDDGSGELRIFLTAASGIGSEGLARGAWIEVTGVLGQETTGSQPNRGYRVLPRDAADVRIVAPVSPDGGGGANQPANGGGTVDTSTPVFSVERQDLSEVGLTTGEPVGATLVAGSWPELGLAGMLWDGSRLRGIGTSPEAQAAIARIIEGNALPAVVGVVATPTDDETEGLGIELLAFGADGAMLAASGAPAAPDTSLEGGEPLWVTLTGRLTRRGGSPYLDAGGERVALDLRCTDASAPPAGGPASVTGVGIGGAAPRLVVPCGGIERAPQLAAGTKGRALLIGNAAAMQHGVAPANAGPPAAGAPSPLLAIVALSIVSLAAALAVAWRQGALRRWGAALGLPIAMPPDASDTDDAEADLVDGPLPPDDRTRELPAVPRLSVVSVRQRPE